VEVLIYFAEQASHALPNGALSYHRRRKSHEQANAVHYLSFVMPGHGRSKNGVLSHAYVPGIHVFPCLKTWMAGASPAMTKAALE
jgi:hypothetical protein